MTCAGIGIFKKRRNKLFLNCPQKYIQKPKDQTILMSPEHLSNNISKKQSCLCVGLDSDIQKIPKHLLSHEDPLFEFNRQLIKATAPYTVAYKLNIAFYEAMGPKGWKSIAKTLKIIPSDILVIADAKRGDIGNTSKLYARTFFETYNFDALTIAPYMGEDSVTPFLEFENKWIFLLALTSNSGALDFQYHSDSKEELYQKVIRVSQHWAQQYPATLGYVVGATKTEQLADIRNQAPNAWFLVPGVGAQGGDLHAVCQLAATPFGGLLINSSRSIIYASQDRDFATQAEKVAKRLQEAMKQYF